MSSAKPGQELVGESLAEWGAKARNQREMRIALWNDHTKDYPLIVEYEGEKFTLVSKGITAQR